MNIDSVSTDLDNRLEEMHFLHNIIPRVSKIISMRGKMPDRFRSIVVRDRRREIL